MVQMVLMLISMSFHQACVQTFEGDTTRLVQGVIARSIERHDPGLARTTLWWLGRRYPYDVKTFANYKSLDSLAKEDMDAKVRECKSLAYWSVVWWGVTKKKRFIPFHEACLRNMLGDTSRPVTKRIERHFNWHMNEVKIPFKELISEHYGNPDTFPEIDSIPTELLIAFMKEAKLIIVRREAFKNRSFIIEPLEDHSSEGTTDLKEKKEK